MIFGMIPWHGGSKMKISGMADTLHDPDYLVKEAREKAMAGDHITAVNYLKKAIETNPRYTEAYTLLANCQDCLGQNEEAIASYDKALQIDPGHADAWFNKGMILKKTGQIKESVQCIEKSIDLYCGR
jgi:tetratricopeptide (TPR) repeat protein